MHPHMPPAGAETSPAKGAPLRPNEHILWKTHMSCLVRAVRVAGWGVAGGGAFQTKILRPAEPAPRARRPCCNQRHWATHLKVKLDIGFDTHRSNVIGLKAQGGIGWWWACVAAEDRRLSGDAGAVLAADSPNI